MIQQNRSFEFHLSFQGVVVLYFLSRPPEQVLSLANILQAPFETSALGGFKIPALSLHRSATHKQQPV